jgi:hypothetical protein
MLAEFAEDENAWLSMTTITGCIDRDLEPIPDDHFTSATST